MLLVTTASEEQTLELMERANKLIAEYLHLLPCMDSINIVEILLF